MSTKPSTNSAVTPSAGPTYPCGEDAPIYRWVFGLFVLLFLGVVCVGLLNFIGMFLKKTT